MLARQQVKKLNAAVNPGFGLIFCEHNHWTGRGPLSASLGSLHLLTQPVYLRAPTWNVIGCTAKLAP